jgi:pimeloyl-ACP methyl ester carboxylesterase
VRNVDRRRPRRARRDGRTLVGGDSGGAYSQIATALRPARIGRLVLVSCETPDGEFPPPTFAALPVAAADLAALARLLARSATGACA